MLEVLLCDELPRNQMELIYNFLLNKNNILNKDISLVNSILWDVIYLQKIFSKSIYSRGKSKKYRLKYNYVVYYNKTVKAVFRLKHILKTAESNILELQVILDNNISENKHICNEITDKIFDTCIELISSLPDNFKNTVITMYSPNMILPQSRGKLAEIKNYFFSMMAEKLQFAVIDTLTFREPYMIYYKLIEDTITQSIYSVSTMDITNMVLDQYGLNIVLNPHIDDAISKKNSKLTKKLIPSSEIEIITRNIMDIKELQDLPEYDYDFNKVYAFSYETFFNYMLNKNKSKKDLIMNRFFKIMKYNNTLYDIFYNLLFEIDKQDICNLDYVKNDKINIKNIIEFNDLTENKGFIEYLNYNINNNLIMNLLKNNNNKLFVSSNLGLINYINKLNIDIIYYENINLLKENLNNKQNINISPVKSNKEFSNKIIKIGKKNLVFLEIIYPIIDYIIFNINNIIKTQYFVYIILETLKVLNIDGKLIILINQGTLNTPLYKKIFNILLDSFNTYDIINNDITEKIYLIFNKYQGLKGKNKHIIDNLLNILIKYEYNNFTYDEIIKCLISNKFTYKINTNINMTDKQIDVYNIFNKKQVLWDINIHLQLSSKLGEFYNKLNRINSKNIKLKKKYFEYYNANNCKSINNFFLNKIHTLFKFINKYNIDIDMLNVN